MTNPGYVELHCHSNFSLLDGASHPEDLVKRAAELEMPALALTDHDALYGALRFARAARAHGIRPIFGAELTLDTGAHLTLLVKDETGWQNLCRLISLGRANASKGQSKLSAGTLSQHTQGLIALSGCRNGEVAAALLRGDPGSALAAARTYKDWFGAGNFWIELQHHLLPDDQRLVRELAALAEEAGVGVVAANNVHYVRREGHRLQDVLVCIKHLTNLDAAAHLRRPGSEYYLKSARQMAPLFEDYPRALANTLLIAEQCQFELQYGLQDLPQFRVPQGQTAEVHLRWLCEAAIPDRYGQASQAVCERLEHEIEVISRSGLANYFLIVHDIVRYARENRIRCQGRGSAANSLVAYLLGISPIDPLAHDLVFERFLSDERRLAPDIDIDFDAAERERVIQYIYSKYGTDYAAMACTFVTFQARSALRDVGRALGIPRHLIDRAAKALDVRGARQIPLPEVAEGKTSIWHLLVALCREIDGFPRHLGIHNGGMVIMGLPLASRLPTEPATMAGRSVVQWDKDSLEEAGLVKIDLLGLRMLSVLEETCDLVEKATGRRPDIDRLRFDQKAIYDLISSGDTVGLFQVESRAQAGMLPRMKPRSFSDIIIAISLIRPGPIIGDMVHPYLRRRAGEEEISYLHPSMKPALEETKGVVLFQEQILKLGRDVAGLTPGQGELLRRALGSKHAGALLEGLRTAFLDGAVNKGVSLDIAEQIFEKLRAFGSYSFPKSHAAAFAVIVYQSAWLRLHAPAAYYTSLLNQQPMGFWAPSEIISDARRHGVEVLGVDIQCSQAECTVEGDTVQLGFRYVKGFGEASIEQLVDKRKAGFRNLKDFCMRTNLPRSLVRNLIKAGAMDCWGDNPQKTRRQLGWELARLDYPEEQLDLVFPDEELDLPPLSRVETLNYEYESMGLAVSEHPMALYREWFEKHHILDSAALAKCEHGTVVRVGGMNVMHQAPPTAKGVHFITLDTQTGMLNLIIHPKIYQSYKRVIQKSRVLVAEGEVQRKGEVINVVVRMVGNVSSNVLQTPP